ncbi:nucleotidyl transferase AbiEii/AbiGii toxin family protein [Actinophytocola sp.]|uniref:nucleotidyl transferase AbiEii/AbiGii toxin family protein n=1 Tax=Actinophytocola sp. TaxID=1872138 RepID=UPI0025C02BDE|nr:nucleotidyl transferase AbiEii/AbiGii toxin family protein [Actinophytocola sp.]
MTPRAFRAALKDRFSALVKADPRLSIDELQRQFAYDRVLARCFTGPDSAGWVLKGAGALLARLEGIARHSKDIDLYYAQQAAGTDRAVEAFLDAIDRDLGDHFRFEVTKTSALQEEAKGRRVHLDAFLGSRYAAFHVDIVVGTAMSGKPDTVPPLTPIDVDGLIRPPYRVFPMADHVADKVCAIIELHSRADGTVRVSSRVKDLVDIAIIARTQSIPGPALGTALLTGVAHRGLTLPSRFDVPDIEAWRTGYARRADDVPGQAPPFEEAIDLAHRLLDPVFAGPITATWNPNTCQWDT